MARITIRVEIDLANGELTSQQPFGMTPTI